VKISNKFKKFAKVLILILFIGFIALQFIPSTFNQSDVVLETDFEKVFEVPNDIKTILKTSCYDCHSNNTRYPWYNRVQPAAWFMEGHIKEAKEELNFSEFGAMSKRRQKSKLKSIISQIKNDEMPLPSYTYIHWDAILSEQEKEKFEDWINEVRSGL